VNITGNQQLPMLYCVAVIIRKFRR